MSQLIHEIYIGWIIQYIFHKEIYIYTKRPNYISFELSLTHHAHPFIRVGVYIYMCIGFRFAPTHRCLHRAKASKLLSNEIIRRDSSIHPHPISNNSAQILRLPSLYYKENRTRNNNISKTNQSC